MRVRYRTRMRRTFQALAISVLLTSAGCIPTVAWLPDSSGIVYVDGQRRLVHLDVSNKTEKILVADTQTHTFHPAVSPDGKRIAVARIVKDVENFFGGGEAGASTMQVIVFGRDGKEMERSKTFEWRPGAIKRPRVDPIPALLFWEPQGNKLLIDADERTGIYDLESKKLTAFPGSSLMVFETSPIRPDGKGFMLFQFGGRPGRHIYFVDWKGQKIEQQIAPGLLDKEDHIFLVQWPFAHSSRWDGDLAIVRGKNARVQFDTGKGKATFEEIKPAFTQDQKRIHHEFRLGGVSVRVIEQRKETEKQRALYLAEILSGDGKQRRIVAKNASLCSLVPAPNRKMVAIVFQLDDEFEGPGDNPPTRFLIVDQKGEIIATTAVPEFKAGPSRKEPTKEGDKKRRTARKPRDNHGWCSWEHWVNESVYVICSYWIQKWQKMAENLENPCHRAGRKHRQIK